MKNLAFIRAIMWFLKFSRVILVLVILFFVVDASLSIFNVKKQHSSFMPLCYFTSANNTLQAQTVKVQSSIPLKMSDIIVQFDGLPPKDFIPWIIVYRLISYALGFYVLNLLIRVVKTVMENQLFNRQNAIYLRYSAIAIISGFLMNLIFSIFETIIYKDVVSLDGFDLLFVFEKYTSFGLSLGLILLVIAEVFRVGTELKEESDLTV